MTATLFSRSWKTSFSLDTPVCLATGLRQKGWAVYLLDTNVLSLLVRAQPSAQLIRRLGERPAESLFTSCICVMELRHGAARRRDGGALWQRIEREILSRVRILAIGVEQALLAGDILAHPWAAGKPIDVEDVLIGATAISKGLTVVTNNLAHFQRIPNLQLEDWTAG
jgi:tRNA(fMet)-specific endonuclease VapC